MCTGYAKEKRSCVLLKRQQLQTLLSTYNDAPIMAHSSNPCTFVSHILINMLHTSTSLLRDSRWYTPLRNACCPQLCNTLVPDTLSHLTRLVHRQGPERWQSAEQRRVSSLQRYMTTPTVKRELPQLRGSSQARWHSAPKGTLVHLQSLQPA